MSDYWKKKMDELEKETKKTPSQSYWDRKRAELEEEKKRKTGGRSFQKDEDEDDIAPIKSSKDDGKLDFFQKGAFEDGYQFGDVTRTILGSVGDAGVNAVKGVGGLVEGLTDLASYGVAGVAEAIGKDSFADNLRKKTQESYIDKLMKPAEDYLDKYSVFGRTSDAILQGVGQVGGILATGGLGAAAGLGTAGVTALTTGVIGLSGMGSGMGEAYQGGATDEEATLYGAISGTADAISELIFGGLGKAVNAVGLSKGLSSADDILAKKVSSMFSKQIMKNFSEFGIKAGAEGFEEVLAGIAQAAGKKVTYMSEEEFSKILQDENLLEQFVVATVTSGFAQTPGLHIANKTGSDFITGLNQNEQAVVKKEIENRIAEAEADGTKLNAKEKAAIEAQVEKDLEKGYISTDLIDEVVGGFTYQAYKDSEAREDALFQEYEELGKATNPTLAQQYRYRELDTRVKSIKDNDIRSRRKEHLNQYVAEQVSGSRLAESYNEKARKGQVFEADLTKYDAKQQAVIKKAVDSGILNNTNRTHEFVDMIAKISADKGVLFDFTNNEKLKNSGFAVDGKAVNGYVTKDGITVNIQSSKALNSIVGHEITHVLEGTDLYTELQNAVVEYAKTKGDYQGRFDSLSKLYEAVEGADINAELTADLVGDYLFTDSDFINNLSTNHRNVFQKIYDEVKYLLKVATAGSKEARELEKVKRAFEKAYREGETVRESEEISDSKTKYSIREEAPPKNTGVAYKVFYVKDGKLYPPMVANPGGADTPMGVWLNADMGTAAPPSKTGRAQVKAGGKGTQGGGGSLAFRPGWHLGDLPRASQFDRVNPETGKKELFPENFVWAEVEYAKDVDYQEEAMSYGYTDKGKFRHAYAGLPKLPENGYYRYRTNPKPDTVPWVITGAMKVNRLLSDAEVNAILEKNGVPPVHRQGGDVGLDKFGFNDDGTVKYSLSAEQQEFFKDSVVRDENGNLKVMYHGTSKGGHTVFDTYGSNYGLFGTGSYFTDSKTIGESYTKKGKGKNPQVYEAYLNIKNPMDMDAAADPAQWAKAFPDADFPESGTNEQFYRAVEEFYADQWMSKWEVAEEIQAGIESNMGYDGITHIGGGRVNPNGERHQVYIAFQPEQIKNIDNAKPTEDPDIRYSLSVDSDGNKLTEEQERYFRSSKMRDENGKLKPMYHGSKDGGFHVFDKRFSDDHTSFFFVDSNDVASSYSGTSETYAARSFKTAEDFNRFFAEIGTEEYEVQEKDGKFRLYEDGDVVAESDSAVEIYEEFRDWSGLGYGDVNYKVYLNLVNPLEVDAKGREWNEVQIPEEHREKFNKIIFRINHPKKRVDTATTRNFAEYANAQGYDGVIFKNILDVGGYGGKYDPHTVAIAFDSNQIKSVANQKPTTNKDIRYSISGVNAKTANSSMLLRAEHMLNTGADSETVRKETGWYKGYDGKMRFEIDDSKSKLIENPALEKHNSDGKTYFTGKLSDILDHGDLYEAYPQLRNVNIIIQETEPGISGVYQPNSNYITLSLELFKRHTKDYEAYLNGGRKAEIERIEQTPEYQEYNKWYEDEELSEKLSPEKWLEEEKKARDNFFNSELGKRYYQLKWGKVNIQKSQFGWGKEAREVLMHEIQHAIQKIENFARGSTIGYWNRVLAAGDTIQTEEQKAELREAEDKLYAIYKQNPRFYLDMTNLLYTAPDMPRGKVDWDTLEQIEEDPVEWQEFDKRRDALEEEYGSLEVFDFFGLYHDVERYKKRSLTADDAYYSTAGEIEARDTANRLNLTAEERRNKRPNIDSKRVVFTDRYSLSEPNAEHPTYGSYNVYGKDIALNDALLQEEIAPTVSETESVAPVAISKTETTTSKLPASYQQVTEESSAAEMFPDDLAPVESELDKLYQQKEVLENRIVEAVNSEDMDAFTQANTEYDSVMTRIEELENELSETENARVGSLDDADAPPEMEAPYPGEASEPMEPADPFADRDMFEVGKRNVKAYQYENPEVKPFFTEAALGMLDDLHRGTKGEKIFNGDVYYQSGGEKGWDGTKRSTTADIAALLDEWHYTYAEIEAGLNAIIEDDGKENNAVSKRIEFMLDDRLRNGYTDVWGERMPANQEYINLLNEKQITEYSKEAFERFMATADQYAPPEDIAPVKQKPVRSEQMKLPLYHDPNNVSPAMGEIQADGDIAPVFETESGQQSILEPVTSENAASTRKALHAKIMDNIKARFAEKGFDFDNVLKEAKNLSTFATVDNIPQRVMEKALGYKEGGILSDITVNQVAQNETKGIKWLNSFTDRKKGLLAQISKQYNIKPGSKESAAAQMYAEGFYVNEQNEIISYGDKELAADFPDAVKQAQIKGLARDSRIRQIYDDTLKAINESRTRNAYPEIPRLDNYFLHFRAMNDTFSKLGLPFNPNDIRAKDLPTDLNGVTADLKPGQPFFASAMHREGKRTSFDLLGGLEQYLSSAKNQIYHIDDIQNLRALRNYIADTYGQANGLEGLDALSEEEQQDRIEQVYDSHLSTFAKFLNEEANVLAGKTALIDRGLEGIIGRRGMTFLDTVNRQVGANMVGYNVSSSLTNFLSPVQAFAKTNKAAFIKGMAQFASNKVQSIYGKGDGFAEQSPVMIRRKGAERFHRTLWQKMSDPGYALMSAVDSVSTELIARAKYNDFVSKGMDSQKAHIETDKWVSRLMGDRSLGQQPQLYNSKMLGIVTKFQLEVRNQLDSQFYDTIQETKASNEDIENGLLRNAKTAAKVTSTFVQLAVAQHLFGKAFESIAGYNPAFDIISAIIKTFGWDDDEESEDTALDNIEQGFLELLEDMPYSSTFTGGRIPISSALPVAQFIKGKDQYGNEKSRWETLGEAAPYYLMPGGYGQLKKIKAGMEMFSEEHPIAGSYTDSGNLRFPVEDTLASRAQAAVFGQYASGNARDYFDNDYAPLKENQIQEYADSGMSIQDYRKYRDGLKDFDKQADKANYINSLDLTEQQKIVLKSYLYDEEGYKEENPEKYAFLENEGIGYIGYKELDEDTQSAWSWAFNHQDEYQFYKENGVMPGDYTTYYIPMLDFGNEDNEAYQWAFDNPEKATFGKVFSEGVTEYRRYASELYNIKADKDENGKSISGSRKEKVLDYINSLDIDYGAKLILFKNEYNSDDESNYEIIDYLNSRSDISFEEEVAILRELGFTVTDDGTIYWD